jgi:hypothetical protein
MSRAARRKELARAFGEAADAIEAILESLPEVREALARADDDEPEAA